MLAKAPAVIPSSFKIAPRPRPLAADVVAVLPLLPFRAVVGLRCRDRAAPRPPPRSVIPGPDDRVGVKGAVDSPVGSGVALAAAPVHEMRYERCYDMRVAGFFLYGVFSGLGIFGVFCLV